MGGERACMKMQPIAAVLGIGLFLYWVVQDPVGAASVIKHVVNGAGDLIELIANRVVRFLDALV